MEEDPPQESIQNQLTVRLVEGTVSPSDFLNQLLELDQSTYSRNQSIENLAVLESAEVRDIFRDNKENFAYKNLLSLTHFHIGQLSVELDKTASLTYFESALAASMGIDWEGYEEWRLYIEATILYIKLDVEHLQAIFLKMAEGKNKAIVGRFIDGLTQRGMTDYEIDYGGYVR
jgi:hypothetical protein